MAKKDVITRLDAAARQFAKERDAAGKMQFGVLLIPRDDLYEFAKCGRSDWEDRNWRIFKKELKAIQEGSESEVASALKSLLNSTWVPISEARVVDNGKLEIVPGNK